MTLKILTVDDVVGLFPNKGKRKMVGAEVVRAALNTGKMAGRKIGNQWFTTEDAVKRWIESGESAKK